MNLTENIFVKISNLDSKIVISGVKTDCKEVGALFQKNGNDDEKFI